MYTYKQFGNKFVLNISNRAEITTAITAFVEKHDIKLGTVYGIGAVNKAVLYILIKKFPTFHSKSIPLTTMNGPCSFLTNDKYVYKTGNHY